ncbi:MAG: zf-HC2 domain-containing protein [Edaphobacter sp.]
MADFNQFGSAQPPLSSDAQHCAQCEAMLADALDGTLSAADQAAFDLHMRACVPCSAMLADAQRGAAWLEMLKSPRPEPSADLLERILAQTCNQAQIATGKQSPARALWQPGTILGHPGAVSVPALQPAYASATILPFRSRVASSFRLRSIGQTLLQPRLAMTAAMAFFSIALTLNLTGVQVSNLRLSDLSPSSLKRNFYEANAHVLRYYDNLKVVYELESRVRDLQRSNISDDLYRLPSGQSTPAIQQEQQPAGEQPDNRKPAPPTPDTKKQDRPAPGSGSSLRENPRPHVQFAGLLERRDTALSTQTFIVSTPNFLKYLQEGELV